MLIFKKNINLINLITILYRVFYFLLCQFFLSFICNIHIAKSIYPMFEMLTEKESICHVIFHILTRQDGYLRINCSFLLQVHKINVKKCMCEICKYNKSNIYIINTYVL